MSTLYEPEPGKHLCPQHAELYAELSDEDLINYAYTSGACAGQLDRINRHAGFTSDRSDLVRGGFRYCGKAEEAYTRGYNEELDGQKIEVESTLVPLALPTQLDMDDI